MSRLTNNLTVYMTRVRPRRISCDEGVRTTPSFSNACDSQPAELMRPLGSVDQCGCLWLIIYDSFLKSDVTVHDFWFVELTAVSSECNGRKTSLRSWQTLERSCSSADNTKSCICFLGTNGSFVLCKRALKEVAWEHKKNLRSQVPSDECSTPDGCHNLSQLISLLKTLTLKVGNETERSSLCAATSTLLVGWHAIPKERGARCSC